MADLETKLMYGETAGYCSSSDDGDDGMQSCSSSNKVNCSPQNNDNMPQSPKQSVPKNPRNTGPKGVLDDYRAYEARFQREQCLKDEKIIAQAKYCTLYGEKTSEDLEQLRRQRLREMKDRLFAHGKIDELMKKEQFLDYIEKNHDSWILIHIYGDDNEGCITLNKIFNTLIVRYPSLKLAKVLPAVVGMSSNFRENALPTLQVYYNEILRGNFVRITDQLGEQFTADQLVHFLSDSDEDY